MLGECSSVSYRYLKFDKVTLDNSYEIIPFNTDISEEPLNVTYTINNTDASDIALQNENNSYDSHSEPIVINESCDATNNILQNNIVTLENTHGNFKLVNNESCNATNWILSNEMDSLKETFGSDVNMYVRNLDCVLNDLNVSLSTSYKEDDSDTDESGGSPSEYNPETDAESDSVLQDKSHPEANTESESSSLQNKNKIFNNGQDRKYKDFRSSLDTSTADTPGKCARDDTDMFVDTSDGKRGQGKRTFCMFCKKMQSKFPRHLENVHKDIAEVRAFSILPKKNPERKRIIDAIRKKCQYFFNTDNSVNDGELLVCRRPRSNLKRTAQDFQVCHSCKSYFSKNNIRHHAQRCFGYNGRKNRTLMVMSRRAAGRIHPEASKVLRREIFPVLREDDVVRIIRYDRVIILYGNKMCCKYRLQHQQDMIRANLRLLGRFLIELKKINENIIEFATLYDPKFYDDVITAINEVAGFDEEKNIYRAPSTAYALGTIIKKIGHFLITDCIKRHDTVQKANVEDFLKLHTEDIGISVNKTVMESQTQQKRQKKIKLPSVKDIKKLLDYLNKVRNIAYKNLKLQFTFDNWLTLAQVTLTFIQVFNRRRAGEIERILIEDFENYESIGEDHLKSLSADSQKIARKYVRFVIRGKLNRTVPVLLSQDLLAAVKMVLKYRKLAEVPQGNRYVFGIPGLEKKRYKYIRACFLLRKFAKESGVDFPSNLTGTTLRKHIATNCINLNLSEGEITDIANFMGHADKIHREHYRQPIVSREILRMSKVLELAQGNDENETDDSEEEMDDEQDSLIEDRQNFRKIQTLESSTSMGESFERQCDNSYTSDLTDFFDENTILNDNKKKKQKIRATSPYGAVKLKRRWSKEETKAALTLFSEYIRTETYPSLKKIQSLCRQYKCLKPRSPTIIKSWISNKIKKQKHKLNVQKEN